MTTMMYGSNPGGGANLDIGDNASEQGFVKFFERMDEKPEGTIRLFERDKGAYYSAHGSDASLIATLVFKTSNALKYLGSKTPKNPKGLPSVSMNPTATKGFLRDALTARQMRIEIYTQAAGHKKDPGTGWSLSRQASPGNLSDVEDLLFSHHDLTTSPITMAFRCSVKDKIRTVGVAFADVSSREIGVAEFVENDLFSNTESLVIQLGVKECMIQNDEKRTDYDMTKVRTILERCGVVTNEIKPSHFQPKNVEQDLNRLLSEKYAALALPEFNHKIAMHSVAALISSLSLLANPDNHASFSIKTHDLSQFMKLDASALLALNLLPDKNDVGNGKNRNLLSLLNKCKTPQGQRLLATWLKQPLVNLHEIKKRQNLVEVFVEDSDARRNLQNGFFKSVPDLSRISKRLQKKNASLEEIVRVYQVAITLPELIETLASVQVPDPSYRPIIDEELSSNLQEFSDSLNGLRELVESTIDLNEISSHNYVIKPDFDESLQSIKDSLVETRDGLDEEHVKIGKKLGLDIAKKLHLESNQVHGYCFRVTKAESSVIRDQKGIIDLGTQKAGTMFTTSHLKELASNFADLQQQYEKTQSSLVREVVSIASSYTPVLESLDLVIAKLDVLVSFAFVSVNAPIPYVKPKMLEKGGGALILEEARHPCLEMQDEISFIPNDINLARGKSNFQIITGPNMGGKSTYIRTAAVLSLMAQVGCFVPASEAQVPIFDCILARVGAGDSQLRGVSTFMGEMLESALILKSATKDSLVIIDELGRGTSTYDGFGLAWAISEYIATKIGCFSLFATHFHELTSLADQVEGVENLNCLAHVSAGDKDAGKDREITLLYKVVPGICDQSFGIHVAELANFPERVVKLAKRKAEELEDFGDAADLSQNPFTKHSKTDTDEGTALVKEFLEEWAARLPSGEDAEIEDGDDEERAKIEFNMLKEVAEKYKERIEGNPFTKDLLTSF